MGCSGAGVASVVPMVEHRQELNDEQNGKRHQKHQAQRLHPHGVRCQRVVWVVLRDLDAQNITANGLEEERRYNP